MHSKHMPYLEASVLTEAQHCVIVASYEKNKFVIRAFAISPETNAIAEAGTPVTLKSMVTNQPAT